MVQTSAPCPFVGRLALSPHGIVTTTYYWKSNQSNSKKVEILKIPINQTYVHVFLPFYIFETSNGIWTESGIVFFNHEKFVSLLGIPENPQRPNHVFTLCLILVEKVGASETTSPTEQKGDPCVYVSISLHSTAKLRVANTCHHIPWSCNHGQKTRNYFATRAMRIRRGKKICKLAST